MKDGRIVAADLQYYANAGNTVDESTLVRRGSASPTGCSSGGASEVKLRFCSSYRL